MTRCRQAVLLAAGAGARLLPHTRDRPKCLVPVAGRPLIDHLLDALAPVGIEELVVVTGYLGERLRRHLDRAHRALAVTCVDNDAYATTNNIYSLHLAAVHIRPPFLLLESDIYAEPAVVAAVAEPDRAAVAVYAPHMSGTGVSVASDGQIRRFVLGAHLQSRSGPLHKTVNFYSFSTRTWEAYAPALDRWIRAGRLDRYYEAVLAQLVDDGAVTLNAVDVSGLRWAEIDDMSDLRRAEDLAVHRVPTVTP